MNEHVKNRRPTVADIPLGESMRRADEAESAAIHGLTEQPAPAGTVGHYLSADPEAYAADVAERAEEEVRRREATAAEAELVAEARRRSEAAAAEAAERILNNRLADAIEAVARARAEQARKVCSPHDARLVRDVWTALRAVQPATGGADADPAWGTQP